MRTVFATEEEAWAFVTGRGVNDIALAKKRIAARMAKNVSESSTRNIHFSVIDNRKPKPFLTHWRHKNTSGVSYPRQETAAAEAWIATALLAGYTVFWHQRKRMWGAGRSLKSGDYLED